MDIKYNPILKSFFGSYRDNGIKKCVHCKTIEEAKKLCELFDSFGEKWAGGANYIENIKLQYKDKTVYVNDNCYGDLAWAEKYNVEIIPVERFLKAVNLSDLLIQYDAILDLSESGLKLYNLIDELNLWPYLAANKEEFKNGIDGINLTPFYISEIGRFVNAEYVKNLITGSSRSWKVLKVI